MKRLMFALLLLALPHAAEAAALIEPRLTIHPAARQQPHVALTLDACTGHADDRILSALVENRIPATVFVTARWLKRNGAALSASGVEKRLARARDGDVIIAHVNHPEKPAGAGLVKGILSLKAKGYMFVKLGAPPHGPSRTPHSS